MSWRHIIIENSAKISCRNEQLEITTDKKHSVPLEDLDVLLLENMQSSITSAALAMLAEHAVALLVCNTQHTPCGVLLPYAQHFRQLQVIRKQLAMTVPTQKRIWKHIVVAKIQNQATCLKLCGKQAAANHLYEQAAAVRSGDAGNAEAVAAAFYFTQLFEIGFTRGAEDGRNSAMNYGYAIMRACVARSIAAYGLFPCIGVHHCNELNAFNLADDMIEPFRAVVDLFVATNVSADSELTPHLKRALVNLMCCDVCMEGRYYTVSYAMERMVQSLVCCTEDGGVELKVPALILLKQHQYE